MQNQELVNIQKLETDGAYGEATNGGHSLICIYPDFQYEK